MVISLETKLDIQSSFVKVWPGEVIAIISALRHFFTLIVYLNPGQWNAFLWLHMPDNKKFFSLEIYGVIYKGLTTNITTCPNYPRCNFNRARVYNIFHRIIIIMTFLRVLLHETNPLDQIWNLTEEKLNFKFS